jgi:hypothetical protein
VYPTTAPLSIAGTGCRVQPLPALSVVACLTANFPGYTPQQQTTGKYVAAVVSG